MKNIQDVLREKEAEIERLNREIKLLRVAARILQDEASHSDVKARAAEAASSGFDEPVLEVVPANAPIPTPADGDASPGKRWP